MFIHQYPSHLRERSTSRSSGSPAKDVSEGRRTRERSSSTSDNRDIYTKRSSIFSKRPKSILTTASNDSSTRSISSTSSGSEVSRRSLAVDALATSTESENAKGRFFFNRNLKNRMSGMTGYPTAQSTELGRSKSGKGVRISAPFDFQHIAKIDESQTIGVDSAEVYQNFRSLSKGHRHAVFAPSPEADAEPMELPVKARKPPPLRPQRPDDLWDHQPATAPLPEAEQHYLSATFIDNHRPPMSADYREPSRSRRMPSRSSSNFSQSHPNGPLPALSTAMDLQTIDSFDQYIDQFVPLYDSQPPGWIENSLPLLHTVSPVDSFSDHVRTPAFNPPLEQVPEEPEGTFSNRPSRDLGRRPSLRHSKSTPVIATRFRSSIDPFVMDNFPLPATTTRVERPVSQCSESSDTLGNPHVSSWQETRHKSKARSLDLGEPNIIAEPSWEDYIEYCYEHNAEADCDFDWQETSHFDDNDSEASECWSEQYSPYTTSLHPKREDARSMKSSASHAQSFASEKSDRVPSHNSIPELDYRYSRATSTASLSIATPRDGSLYRASDVPPLPTDMNSLKDAWGSQYGSGDNLYNEIMIGRTAVVPDSPQHLDDKSPSSLLYGGLEYSERSTAAPSTSVPTNRAASIVAQRSMKKQASRDFSEAVPPPLPKDYPGAHGSATAWPLGEQINLTSVPPPTSMPREMALSPLEPAMHEIKPPAPPKSPTASELDKAHSFLTTPSPKSAPRSKPSPIIEEAPPRRAPLHISFPSIDLPPLQLPNSPPTPSTEVLNRAGSVADRIGPLPSTPPRSSRETPGTPDSASSAPEGLGRMGYSLFPSKKSSMNSLNGPSLPTPPTSVPMAMSEPSLTRPVSRAESQASSSRSSTRALSIKSKSSATKKANIYQQRFPLGI